MSNNLQIPKALKSALNLYHAATHMLEPYGDLEAQTYFRKMKAKHLHSRRSRLIAGHEANDTSFLDPDLFKNGIGSVYAPIFDYKLKPLPLEEFTTESLTKAAGLPPVSDEEKFITLVSSLKNDMPAHVGKIFDTFKSFFGLWKVSPSDYLEIKMLRDKLHSPIVLFFRERQDLFSEQNLLKLNASQNLFQKKFERLAAKYTYSKDINQRLFNYSFLINPRFDLLRASLLSLPLPSFSAIQNHYEHTLKTENPLCAFLEKLRQPIIQSKDGTSLDLNLVEFEKTVNKEEIMRQSLQTKDASVVRFLVPYTVLWSNIHFGTIGEGVIDENHEELLNIIENQDTFELVAARLDLSFPSMSGNVYGALEQMGSGSTRSQGHDYQRLLDLAQRRSHPNSSNKVKALLERVAQLGLVKVEDGPQEECFYITNDNM